MRTLNRIGFVELGSPYFGWLTAISSAIIRVALAHGLGLIFYGENGEKILGCGARVVVETDSEYRVIR